MSNEVLITMDVKCLTEKDAEKFLESFEASNIPFDSYSWPEINEVESTEAEQEEEDNTWVNAQILIEASDDADFGEFKKLEHHIDYLLDEEWFFENGIDYDHIENVKVRRY